MTDQSAKEISQLVQANHDVQQLLSNESNVFPIKTMTGVAGRFAKLYSEYLESPIEFFYFSFLTVLGSIISDKVTLDLEIHPQPRMFTLIIGKSAEDRKSTAINKAIKFFETMLAQEDIKEIINKYKIHDGIGSAGGIQKLHKNANKILFYFDEFSSFISKTTIKSSQLLQAINTLFESNSYANSITNSLVDIKDAYVSIIGATTFETYEKTWESNFTDIGFNNRMFIINGVSTKKISLPQSIPQELKLELVNQTKLIVLACQDGYKYTIDDDARELYDTWYKAKPVSEYMRRLDTYALRLAILIALSAGEKTITYKIMLDTLKIIQWQFVLRRENCPIDADNQTAKMEQRIIKQLVKTSPLNNRDLQKRCNAHKYGIGLFKKALDALVKDKQIKYIVTSKEYCLNNNDLLHP